MEEQQSLTPDEIGKRLRRLGRGPGRYRSRHQNGWVEETGKKRKSWRGHYYVYVREADGSERRTHRTVTLGFKSQMRKHEAEEKLRAIIARSGDGAAVVPADDLTLEWFWRERYRPMRESMWKESCRAEMIANIERYVIAQIGDWPLATLDKFTLQKKANELAANFSKSVVDKYIVWARAILEEAVEQEYLSKNPARKLEYPKTRAVCKKILTIGEISALLSLLWLRDRLMLSFTLVLGLRPGELLAIRWDDVSDGGLRIDEATRKGKLYEPKTSASKAFVWAPVSILRLVAEWRSVCVDSQPRAFMFPNSQGSVMRLDNYRRRVLKPAADKLVEMGFGKVTFQACRRTCATFLSKQTPEVKDVQAHLRHARVTTTLDEYIQAIPGSVRSAVERLGNLLLEAAPGASPATLEAAPD